MAKVNRWKLDDSYARLESNSLQIWFGFPSGHKSYLEEIDKIMSDPVVVAQRNGRDVIDCRSNGGWVNSDLTPKEFRYGVGGSKV